MCQIIRVALLFICFIVLTGSKTEGVEGLDRKYILYDVNPGEGFNLRRDVFMRIAVLVRNLNLKYPTTEFVLVLPPWGPLYHWQSRDLGIQSRIPWSLFFDVQSISKFVPVMELPEFLSEEGGRIGQVYYLQGYAGGWKDGVYQEKFQIADCLNPTQYEKDEDGLYNGYYWDYDNIRAEKFDCLSVQGSTRTIRKFLAESPAKSIMLDRAETLLHDFFGDVDYWGIRRAMRFSKPLVDIANTFRKDELDSTDEKDDTRVKEDWRDHRAGRRVRGGPYACVHLRRKDYVRARVGQIPSIQGAAEQLLKKLEEQKLSVLYVSTDAPDTEFQQLKSHMDGVKVIKYKPTTDVHKKFKDGGEAILDQVICSHAKYFIGSYESTFTFRIQEEREIMGFPLKSTFDMLCADGKSSCEKGSQWKVEWGPDQDWSIHRPSSEQHIEL